MPRLVSSPTAGRPAWQRMFLSAAQVNSIAGNILTARQSFLAAGDQASALKLAQIYVTFNDSLNNVARQAAAKSEVEIRVALAKSQKRPDTARGGIKLKNTIRSEWAKGSPSLAYVGVGVIAELDRAVNPNSSSRDPYWKVQEYGFVYDHYPEGFFFGPGYQGAAMPNPAQFRQHPLFIPSTKGGKFKSPPKVPARHFLRNGTDVSIAFWTAGVEAASLTAAAEMKKLLRLRRP